MSTLRATNIKNPDSSSNNIVLDGSGGVVISGVTTITTLNASEITASSFVGDGSGLTGAGSTVSDDTTTNATFYPVITQTTTGTITSSKVSTTKLSFNPSTGTLSATSFSGSGSSLTGVPISTGVSGLGANVATFLATPSSSNLASAVTDETGSGALVFANTPTLVTPNIGAATGTSLSVSGQLVSTQANSTTTGGGQIYLNGVTGNRIDFNQNGVAAPAFATRSVGAKIVLYPGIGPSNADYAFGIESSTLWSGVPTTSDQFKWYAGTTNVATLSGTGNFNVSTHTVTGNLSAWNTTTPGTGVGGIHLGAASGTSNVGPAITFGARDAGSPSGSNAQAGIYINSDGSYGTKMYFATTDSYATGSKVAMSIDHLGAVNISRSNLTVSGNVTAYSSDKRLKENFNHIESPLEKVQKLNGYTFDWNKKSEELGFTPQYKQNDVGLIAQEVQAVLPQAAVLAPFDRENNSEGETVSKSGENYLTIQYERLVPLLVEAIKELKEEVNELKERLEEV